MHPQRGAYGQHQLPQPRGHLAAHAVTAALTNPYAQAQQAYYPQASHYAQAYAQPGTSYASYGQGTTAGGYTLSSTYVPSSYPSFANELPASTSSSRPRAPNQTQQAYWYQPGNCRCTKPGCAFTGSKKAVEVHMMDRHLIYPPGWETRKRKPDWDADPSLKGKPIPIQGTNIKLDTPEQIAEWIAERKKRFPTATRQQEKEKKLEEAVARGQLEFADARFPQRKKRRTDDYQTQDSGYAGRGQRGRGRGQLVDRGRGRGRGGGFGQQSRDAQNSDGHPGAAPKSTVVQHQLPPRPTFAFPDDSEPPKATTVGLDKEPDSESDSDSDSDSDAPPEVTSSKAPPGFVEQDKQDKAEATEVSEPPQAESHQTSRLLEPPRKPFPRKPRPQPRNPFAPRSSLLRNLLTPEIRMTVSNLSQAIRFLVDNDFLENVELKPGQGSERMIEVVDQDPTPAPPS